MNEEILITEDNIAGRIYVMRNQRVMLDRDLAKLYGVQTKVLKQAVKRNQSRFPEDFMFVMTTNEFENWRSQFVTSNDDKKGLRYAPFCFTENGVAMLSSVLNSEQAIRVNIQIIRVFTRLRQMHADHNDLRLEIEKIKNHLHNQDKNMELVFNYLDELSQKIESSQGPPRERRRIGYKPDTE